MSDFEKMMKKIEQDDRVPENVWDKYVQTLEALPEKKAKTKRYNWSGKIAAAAASVVAVGSLVCYTNPALASKIPVLGGIFKQVEETTTYSGNYSDNAEVLVSEENGEMLEGNYCAEDAGVTVTASEVLYDGASVFLTLKVDVTEGNLLNIQKYDTAGDGTEGASIMYLWGEYEVPGILPAQRLTEDSFYLEGKALDEKTYVGIVKMNLDKDDLQDGMVALKLSGIGYDDATMPDSENMSASNRFEGSWNLQIPFHLDTEHTKKLTFDTEGKEYGLKKILVSPYQVVTEISAPYTEREITREEYEEMVAEKTGGSGEFPISYEEYAEMESKIYAESHTRIFNQDGEPIVSRGGYFNGKSVFAVKGKEITKLHVLVFDSLDPVFEAEISGLTDELIAEAVNYEVVEIETE